MVKPSKKSKSSLTKQEGFLKQEGEFFMTTTGEQKKEIERILKCRNFFAVLEVDPDADLDKEEETLRNSYLSKCLVLKPNQCDHPKLNDAFDTLINAYDTLSDPSTRRKHKKLYFGRLTEEENLAELQEQLVSQLGPNGQMMAQSLARHQPGTRIVIQGPPELLRQIMRNPGMLNQLQNNSQARQQPPVQQQQQQNRTRRQSSDLEDEDDFFNDNPFGGLFSNLAQHTQNQLNRQSSSTSNNSNRTTNSNANLQRQLMNERSLSPNFSSTSSSSNRQNANQNRQRPQRERQLAQMPGNDIFGMLLHMMNEGREDHNENEDGNNQGNNENQQRRRRVVGREGFANELRALADIGFTDENLNLQALNMFGGDVDAAADYLMQRNGL